MPDPPTIAQMWDTIIEYTESIMARSFRKERHLDIKWMRPKIIALTKEMPGSRKIRTALGTVAQVEDLRKLAMEHIAATGK